MTTIVYLSADQVWDARCRHGFVGVCQYPKGHIRIPGEIGRCDRTIFVRVEYTDSVDGYLARDRLGLKLSAADTDKLDIFFDALDKAEFEKKSIEISAMLETYTHVSATNKRPWWRRILGA